MFGSRKQETSTENRNLEGSKWFLQMYDCVILFKYKQRENRSSYLSGSK